jgi:hypothetical protein
MLVLSLFIIKPSKAAETVETFLTLNDISNGMANSSEFVDSLYKSDVEVRNQKTLNCYDYMKSMQTTKDWIDEGSSKQSIQRRKVLSTFRTNINHFEDPESIAAVTMGGCHIPTDVGRTLYNIDSDNGICTIEDTRTGQHVALTPSKQGCVLDFSDPQIDNANKFNRALDVAFNVYDKENQDLIDELKRQIELLKQEIERLKAQIKANNDQRDYYNGLTAKLEHPNSDCQVKKRAVENADHILDDLKKQFDDVTKLVKYYKDLKDEVDKASTGLDDEYNTFIQFK